MKIGVKILSLAAVLSLGCVFLPQSIVRAQDKVIGDWKTDTVMWKACLTEDPVRMDVPIQYTVNRTDTNDVVINLGEKAPDYILGRKYEENDPARVLQEDGYVWRFVYELAAHHKANVIIFDGIEYRYDADTETCTVTCKGASKYNTAYGFCVWALAPANSDMILHLRNLEESMIHEQALDDLGGNPQTEEQYKKSYRRARGNFSDVEARLQVRRDEIERLEKQTGDKFFRDIKKVIIKGNVQRLGDGCFYEDHLAVGNGLRYNVELIDMSQSEVWLNCGGFCLDCKNVIPSRVGRLMDDTDEFLPVPSNLLSYYARTCFGCSIM